MNIKIISEINEIENKIVERKKKSKCIRNKDINLTTETEIFFKSCKYYINTCENFKFENI